jgi:anthranilate phosphoribosyltransferase
VDLSAYNNIDLCEQVVTEKILSTFLHWLHLWLGAGKCETRKLRSFINSGSSNVMEKLGIKFSNDTDFLEMYDKAFVFYTRRYFTLAMKMGPIRKELV